MIALYAIIQSNNVLIAIGYVTRGTALSTLVTLPDNVKMFTDYGDHTELLERIKDAISNKNIRYLSEIIGKPVLLEMEKKERKITRISKNVRRSKVIFA